MNPILDALTGNVLGTSFSELRDSSFSSALNAYESWASELGVSSTASVSTLANTDDGAAVFTLGFNPFKDGTVLKGFHSSEGGIGLYYQQDPGSASTTSGAISATSPNVPLSRFYTGYARMPAVLIATRLGTIDNRSENSRWQQTSDTAIFYSTYRQYNGTNGTVHVAIKITKENKITVVCSNVNTANTYLQFMTFNESLTTRTATSAHGGASFLLSLNTAQEIDLHLAAQVPSLNSELNLTPTLNSAFYLQATKSIQLITGSSLSRFVFGWVGDTALFNEPLPIEQISLTFDQLGRPLVFYRVGENTLKLYWYDPVLQQNVLTNFGIGKDPTACFDFPQDTGQSFTDALLFYVRDDQVFMRIQRDRYAIEYPCPAANERLSILSSGFRIDNRFQVEYKFKSIPDKYFKNYIIESDFTISLLNSVSLNSVIGESLNVVSSSNLSILTQVNVDSIPNYSQEIIEDIVTNFSLRIKNNLNILSLISVDSLQPSVVTTFRLGIKNSLNILSSIFEKPLTPTDVISEISIKSKVNFSFDSEKSFEKNDTGYLFGTSNLGSFITYYDDNLNIYTPLAEPNINTFGTLTEVKLPSCVSADECWFAQVKPNELNKIEFYERYGSNFNLSNTLTLPLIENGRIISIALSSNGNYLAVGFSYSFFLTDLQNKSSDLYYLVKVFKKINGAFQEIPFNNQLTLKGGFVTEEYKDAEIKKGDFPIEELEEQWATFKYNTGVVQLSFNPVDNDLIIIYERIIKDDQPLYINWFNKNGDLFEESLWPIAQTPATPNKMYWQNNNDLVVSHAFSPFHTKYSKLLGSFRVSATTPFPPAKNVVGNAAFTLGWTEGAFKNDIAVLSGGTNPLNRVIYESNSIWSAGGSINPVIDIRNLVLSPKGNKLLCSALFYNESNNTTGLFKIFNKNSYDYVLSDIDLGEYKIDGFGYNYTPNFCYWFTENNQLSLDDTKKVNDSFYLKTYSLVDFSNKKLGVTNSFITEDVRGFNWVWVDINRIRSDDRGIFLADMGNYKVTVEFIYTVDSLNRATIKAFEVIENGIGFSIDILSNGAVSVTNLMENHILTSEYRYTTLGEKVHLALTSSNGITTLWLNGVNQGSVNRILPMFSQSIRLNQGWFRLNQLRITRDVRYTTNFDRITNFNMVKEFI